MLRRREVCTKLMLTRRAVLRTSFVARNAFKMKSSEILLWRAAIGILPLLKSARPRSWQNAAPARARESPFQSDCGDRPENQYRLFGFPHCNQLGVTPFAYSTGRCAMAPRKFLGKNRGMEKNTRANGKK